MLDVCLASLAAVCLLSLQIADMAEALTTSPDSENVWEIAVWEVGYPVVSTLQNHRGLDMFCTYLKSRSKH